MPTLVGMCPLSQLGETKGEVREVPTGVPIQDLREQLSAAAERLLARDGVDALTSRAVTAEAGVAKGILHRHFADFDAFLVTLVLGRIQWLERRGAELRERAGARTVADNVAEALMAILTPETLAVVSLVMSRQELLARLRLITPTGVPVLSELAKLIGSYLTAERGLGRLPIGTDVDRLAAILVGTGHLWCAGHDDAHRDSAELRALVVTVLAGGTVGVRR